MKIWNLTMHVATAEQVAAGVVDLPQDARQRLVALLAFDDLPSAARVRDAADEIADLLVEVAQLPALQGDRAMIGGAPFLMEPLVWALDRVSIGVVYAFSKRESVEETQADGSVKKHSVFRHAGFVESPNSVP